METHMTLSQCLRCLLQGPPEPDDTAANGAQALALMAYRTALKGNDKYFKLIHDFTENEGPADGAVEFCFGKVSELEQ